MSESPFALLELPGIRAVCVGKELDGRAFDARDKSCLERIAKDLSLSVPPRQAEQIHADDIGHLPLHQQALAWGMKKNVHLVQLADNYNPYKYVVIK